ncbi:MAG: hypothetical protein ACKVOK_17000 [Flavobacteriales bacterium]
MGNTEKPNRKFKNDGLTDPKTNQDYNTLKPDPSDPNQKKSVRPDDEVEPTLKEQNDVDKNNVKATLEDTDSPESAKEEGPKED